MSRFRQAGLLLLGLTAAAAAQHVHPAHHPDTSLTGIAHFLQLYTPRRLCMYNEGPLILLHIVSDLIIALAYFTIPLALISFVRRRRDLVFNWMFKWFALFILACGSTHLFGVLDIWYPFYWLDGFVKLITAMASITTSLLLWRLIPSLLALPSPSQLQQQIAEKEAAEASLRELHSRQEEVIAERTAQLRQVNESLEQEIESRKQIEHERENLLRAEQAARTEAEHANRMKDEFLATLSHELRTPLNAILGWTRILQMEDGVAELPTALEVIERNTLVQVKLVEDLLDMNRIISGQLRLDMQPVNLLDVVDSALLSVQPAAQARDVRLETVLDEEAASATGDPARLQQIVWNLLMNAVKFTPKGGLVTVRLTRVDSHLELSVSDTGEGIAPDFLPLVFDRFRQADSSTTRRHGGLGLGLSIVKHLVELHGGSVTASSPGLGQGAVFTVQLPVRAVRNPAAEPAPAERESPVAQPAQPVSLDGVKILIVDDEKDAREMVAQALRLGGADVLLAEDAASAFELIRSHTPDLVISDIGMPEEDGYSLIRRVRKLAADAGGEVPAIALTAFARAEDRQLALQAGFQLHLEKPVDPLELQAAAAQLLKKS